MIDGPAFFAFSVTPAPVKPDAPCGKKKKDNENIGLV